MIILRSFNENDAYILHKNGFSDLSIEQVKSLIGEWNKKCINHKYFEMFAILSENEIIGTISLYEHSEGVLSIGPTIFESHRQNGFGKEAMIHACNIAKEKGYKLVSQQIRCNNIASLALHSSLGFETDGGIYINKKGNQVVTYTTQLT